MDRIHRHRESRGSYRYAKGLELEDQSLSQAEIMATLFAEPVVEFVAILLLTLEYRWGEEVVVESCTSVTDFP